MNVPFTRRTTSSAAMALAALLVVGTAGIADACTHHGSRFFDGPGARTAAAAPPGSFALAVSMTKSGYHRPATGPIRPGDYVKVAVTGCPVGVEGTASSKAFTRPTTLFPTEGRIQGFAKISQIDPGTYPVTVTCPGTSAPGHADVNVA